jgi:hypothetical protein
MHVLPRADDFDQALDDEPVGERTFTLDETPRISRLTSAFADGLGPVRTRSDGASRTFNPAGRVRVPGGPLLKGGRSEARRDLRGTVQNELQGPNV